MRITGVRSRLLELRGPPVISAQRVADDATAYALANDGPYDLSASVFTGIPAGRSRRRRLRLTERKCLLLIWRSTPKSSTSWSLPS